MCRTMFLNFSLVTVRSGACIRFMTTFSVSSSCGSSSEVHSNAFASFRANFSNNPTIFLIHPCEIIISRIDFSFHSCRIARMAIISTAVLFDSDRIAVRAYDALAQSFPMAYVIAGNWARFPSSRHPRHWIAGLGMLEMIEINGVRMPCSWACFAQSFRMQQFPRMDSTTSSTFSYGLAISPTSRRIPPSA
uniref:(northern house mosquito) hypothetical protein n=1 Tax=Culex pipiens TaxID=7175 RepID=A0A8D8I642_CULPI